jgi:peptidoglycan/xylan/chitin deacetylase (PgdA/CDA1 family)
MIENYAGSWSPTANEIVGIYWINERTGILALAHAPAFNVEPVDLEDANMAGSAFAWSPDGQEVVFGIPKGFDVKAVGINDVTSTLWTVDRSGQKAHPVFAQPKEFRQLQIKGWMDDQTVIVADYLGGGNWGVEVLDYLTGELLSYARFGEGMTFKPNKDFIPAVSFTRPFSLFTIPKSPVQDENSPLGIIGPVFPTDELAAIENEWRTQLTFADWWPQTNKMLVAWVAYHPEDQANFLRAAHLLLWDIDEQTATSLFPGGIAGQFSADGQLLSTITFGPADLEAVVANAQLSLTPLLSDGKPHLQIMNMTNRQIILSLPISTRLDQTLGKDGRSIQSFLEFTPEFASSPNSHYLAFLTPGPIQVDAGGWPVSVITETAQAHLNVLDLQARRLLWSIPSNEGTELSWSPSSVYLAYQDSTLNWQLFDLHRQAVIPVTLSLGENVSDPQWSFDGRYLSFLARQPMGEDTYNTTLNILEVTRGAQPLITPTPTLIPGSAPALPPAAVYFISHGDRSRPYVALTFDLCQKPDLPAGFDVGIVNALTDYDARATFFLGGDWMRTHISETRLLAGNPLFELGNHSWSHPDLRELSDASIAREILQTQDILYQITGRQTELFRLPGGEYNDQVLDVIAQHGLVTIQWDADTADPVPDNSADNILKLVTERVQNGSIVLMHANGHGWHTAEALPAIIEYLRGQGYCLVTVSQLIGLKPIPEDCKGQ